MVRFLIRVAVFLGTAALGLFAAKLVLSGFHLSSRGLIVAIVVFAVLQSALAPLVAKGIAKYTPAISGGVGIVTTLLALVVTSLTKGLSIDGIGTWLLGALIVWLVTAVGGGILESIFLKDRPAEK